MEISTAKNNLSSIFLTLILIKLLCANGLNKFRFLNLFKIKSVLFLVIFKKYVKVNFAIYSKDGCFVLYVILMLI